MINNKGPWGDHAQPPLQPPPLPPNSQDTVPGKLRNSTIIIGGIVITLIVVVVGNSIKHRDDIAGRVSPPLALVANGTAQEMLNETGCQSKSSEDKKTAVFNSKYRNKIVTANGIIVKIDHGQVLVKVLPNTFTYDIGIDLTDSAVGYNLEKDAAIKINFVATNQGGCFIPFSGKDGVITK